MTKFILCVDDQNNVTTTTSHLTRVRLIILTFHFSWHWFVEGHKLLNKTKTITSDSTFQVCHFTTWLNWYIASPSNILNWTERLAFKIQIEMKHDYFRDISGIKVMIPIFSAQSNMQKTAYIFLKFHILNCHIMFKDSSFLKYTTTLSLG